MGNAESAVQFRERIQIVIKGKPPAGGEFWLSLWTAPVPTSLVLEVLTPAVLQEMRTRKPENLATLIRQAVRELHERSGGISGVHRSLEILTRVIPIAAKPSADDDFHARYLFASQTGSLGQELVDTLLDLLFEPGFCVHNKLRKLTQGELVPLPTHIWAAGIPSVAKVCGVAAGSWAPCSGNAEAMYKNRIAVLRCLLACLTGTLHYPVEKAASESQANKFAEIVTSREKPHPRASGLFFSLLNTILSYDPVGWGLPYNYLFSSSVPEQLVECCVSVLSVLLSYANDVVPAVHESNPNYFIQIIRKLKKADSFSFLFDGIVRLLEASTIADEAALLYEKRKMGCLEGVIALLFIILYHSKRFVDYVALEKDVGRLVVPIMYAIIADPHLAQATHAVNKKPHNVTELCFMCLLILSANTELCNSLNAVYKGTIPGNILSVAGNECTCADIVIAPLLKLSSELPVDNTVTRILLTFLANACPYLKTIPVMYAEKLCSLFIRSSKPHFLAKSSLSYLYPATVLEIITKFIVYQTQTAFELMYSVICYEKDFVALRDMTFKSFSKAVKESKGAKKVKDEEKKEDGGDEFVPTEEWFDSWKQGLIFKAITNIYKLFDPRIKGIAKGEANDRDAIIKLIKTSNLVGVLPEFKGISVRVYSQNAFYAGIYTKFVWTQAIKKCLLQLGAGLFKDALLLTDPAGIEYVFNPELFKVIKKSTHISSDLYTKTFENENKKDDIKEEEIKKDVIKEEEIKKDVIKEDVIKEEEIKKDIIKEDNNEK